ncbi:RNA-binding protein MEX3D [Prionailurus iriomotensis]
MPGSTGQPDGGGGDPSPRPPPPPAPATPAAAAAAAPARGRRGGRARRRGRCRRRRRRAAPGAGPALGAGAGGRGRPGRRGGGRGRRGRRGGGGGGRRGRRGGGRARAPRRARGGRTRGGRGGGAGLAAAAGARREPAAAPAVAARRVRWLRAAPRGPRPLDAAGRADERDRQPQEEREHDRVRARAQFRARRRDRGSPGRCKIKALRAKTNTYIKTPVRGEEPVFIVTGRKEDVEMAKREILSAAEHFSVIRATRSKAGGLPGAAQGPPHLPGQTTIQVRVPYRVVGLVVGPKGATIKRIQQRTHTYIVTPGRDKEPVFAVTGMPENVDRAREEIEAHITLRTGAFTDAGPDSDFHANGTDVCLDLLGTAAGLWAKAPNPGRRPPAPTAGLRGDAALGAPGGPEAFYAGGRGGPPVPEAGPASPYGGAGGAGGGGGGGGGGSGNGGFSFGGDGPGAPSGPPAPEDCDFGFDFLALDLTVPAAATIWAPFERAAPLPNFSGCSAVNGAPAPPAPGARRSSGTGSPRHSPTLPEPAALGLELPLARRGGAADPVGALAWRPAPGSLPAFPAATSLPGGAAAAAACPPLDSSPSEGGRKPPAAPAPALARECVVCAEGEVMAALVPCGHNLFCMDCAVRICGKSEPECPACRTPATQAIHIFS